MYSVNTRENLIWHILRTISFRRLLLNCLYLIYVNCVLFSARLKQILTLTLRVCQCEMFASKLLARYVALVTLRSVVLKLHCSSALTYAYYWLRFEQLGVSLNLTQLKLRVSNTLRKAVNCYQPNLLWRQKLLVDTANYCFLAAVFIKIWHFRAVARKDSFTLEV